MKHAALLLLTCLLVAVPAVGEGFFPYATHSETLDNGLEVVLVPMSSGGLVSYWTVVRTGARDEYEPGRTGFAHFFEHMMFRGTEKYPADVYGDLVTKIGADSNAFTSDDLTAYYFSIAAEDLETVMDIESDRFQNLAYPEQAFKTEAGAVYGEYRKNRMNPFFAMYEATRKEAFKTHTYGHTAMGYEDDIKAMPTMFDYSKTFFSRYYRPENCVLLIVGDFEVAPTMELVRKYYGGWEKGYEPPKVKPEPPQTEERRIEVPYPGSSLPIVWMAYKADAFDAADRTLLAADILCQLVFGETSELYKKLVLEDKVVEFLSADLNYNRDPGLIDVYTRVKDPAKVDEVIAAIDSAIAEALESLPDAQRLADQKTRQRYGFLMALDTPSGVSRVLSRMLAVTGSIDAVDQTFATYDAITPEDVQAAARKYFVPEKRTVAVLKPKS